MGNQAQKKHNTAHVVEHKSKKEAAQAVKLANTAPVLDSPSVTSDSLVPAIKSALKPRTVVL